MARETCQLDQLLMAKCHATIALISNKSYQKYIAVYSDLSSEGKAFILDYFDRHFPVSIKFGVTLLQRNRKCCNILQY